MPLLYSVVSRGNTVLARFANNCTGNFSEITEQVLAQIGHEDSKMSYSHGSFLFHYILQDQIIYLCISDDVSFFYVNLYRFQFIKFFVLGIWTIKGIFIFERNKKKIFKFFWRTCIFCSTLWYEYWVLKDFSRTNGKAWNTLLFEKLFSHFC